MLQEHSPLWHYLWLGPHVLQVFLAMLIYRKGLHRTFPIFFTYALYEAAEEFTLYGLDVVPSVSADTFWKAFSAGLVVEGLLKIALVGELFVHLVGPWPRIAKIGNRLITGVGAFLVLAAALTAGLTQPVNPYWQISGGHALEQSLYVVECGLILFIFVFAAYFRLAWNKGAFGIGFGLGILSCEHLSAWALIASGILADKSYLLDFLNMATYHVCVLIWFYYLLVHQEGPAKPPGSLPPSNLDVWNRELERLLQR